MLGIIGGSGLYHLKSEDKSQRLEVSTAFGAPSAPLTVGRLGSAEFAFLARHGEQHQFLPSEVNYQANILALKQTGVREIIAVSAVGSLAEDVHPGDLAIVTQYVDFTKGRRAPSFFGNGMVGHVSSAEPACSCLVERIASVCREESLSVHLNKTYACVEGPRFGTRAESFFLRSAGCHVVGMTNVPEAFLAREAQICYCAIAVVTDYDCWMDDPEAHVSVETLFPTYKKSLAKVEKILRGVAATPAQSAGRCNCRRSLQGAVLTDEESLTQEQSELLALLRR